MKITKELKEWGKRIRSVGKCEVCDSGNNLNAHHILDKVFYKRLRLELKNGICLCVRCHKFGMYSAHRNPIWFAMWLKENKKKQFEWIVKKM
jgi:hypothetical protein